MTDQDQELFDTALEALSKRHALARVPSLKRPLVFAHVVESARPFLMAALAHHWKGKAGNLWAVCETERGQERFAAELSTWLPGVLVFPHLEIAAVEGAVPDPEISAERLGVLQRLTSGAAGVVVVITKPALDEQVAVPQMLAKATLDLAAGARADRDELVRSLAAAGYENVPQVADRGQYAVRGGIMDVYSWQQALPVRLEWFDQEIESIREFDLDRQTSVRPLDHCSLLLRVPEGETLALREYLRPKDLVVSVDVADLDGHIRLNGPGGEAKIGRVENFDDAFFATPFASSGRSLETPALRDAFARQIRSQFRDWDAEGYRTIVNFRRDIEVPMVQNLIPDFTQSPESHISRFNGSELGFVYPAARLAVVFAGEILGHGARAERSASPMSGRTRRGLPTSRSQIDFTELTEGELVVHLEHGLARYQGLQTRRISGPNTADSEPSTEEVMVLEFAEKARLYVPLEQAFFVSRYVGLGKRGAVLSHLGDGKWSSAKKAAEKSIYDYAAKLLKVQAMRETHASLPFGPDGQWQKEFEDTFPYKETADQFRAINETKADMESTRPMDRLICGDVGFGKTEVAIRAAFKAAAEGRQVAMLVPTTVLAQQHYENFRRRMGNFPVVVELLSRYRTATEQLGVAEGLFDGSVDVVIGTHRLISKDVHFKNLGLLVVDEEQRFGVRHKERIKERFPNVDVLTLSATPIPRTLYLALTGARDLSTLETPPPNRYPVETVICAYDERIIRTAIDRELARQGQVYFLHNRVEDIEKIRARVQHLCPRARVDIGHGQMGEGELEEVMQRFVSGQTDVLVATTIIESGLDIPNANTIIIDRADRFGLADLYQLRGRVGRGDHKAYAYLMLPRDLLTVGEARKRINAIKQYSTLGAGFKIALRDLEIRGAGNILGLAQSGHLTAVGFDLYCQLLRQAVSKLRGERVRHRVETVLRLDFVATSEAEYIRAPEVLGDADAVNGSSTADEQPPSANSRSWAAYIPADYIEEPRLRIQAYRQFAEVTKSDEVEALEGTWRDRFGPLPPAAANLLAFTRLKLLASARKVQQVEVRGDKVMLTRGGDYVMVAGKFPRLTSRDAPSKMRELSDLLHRL